MITVNKDNRKKKVDEAYETALATIKQLANAGQETFLIHMNLPNYHDGHEVFDKLKLEGVQVCVRGFASSQNSN